MGKAYESTSLGADLIKELVMASMSGTVLSRERLSQFFNMVVVRMFRILWLHDLEKAVLKPLLNNQQRVSESVFNGLAVWWARFEAIKNGNQQLDFIIGKKIYCAF